MADNDFQDVLDELARSKNDLKELLALCGDDAAETKVKLLEQLRKTLATEQEILLKQAKTKLLNKPDAVVDSKDAADLVEFQKLLLAKISSDEGIKQLRSSLASAVLTAPAYVPTYTPDLDVFDYEDDADGSDL